VIRNVAAALACGLRVVTFPIVVDSATAPALTPVNNEAVDATHPDFDGSMRSNL
jgi:hypothetical protein